MTTANTKIDFYILESDSEEQRLHFTCRLVEKITKQQHRILINTDNTTQCEQLDKLLWSFKPESFIPHVRQTAERTQLKQSPIILSNHEDCQEHSDVILGLGSEIPQHFSRFKRFALIINQEPKRLQASRQHYTYFRDAGYDININRLQY